MYRDLLQLHIIPALGDIAHTHCNSYALTGCESWIGRGGFDDVNTTARAAGLLHGDVFDGDQSPAGCNPA